MHEQSEQIPVGYLTPREAAQYTSISVKQLENMRRRGDGPRYCKVGRLCRYPRAELDRWMGRHLIANTAEEVRR